MSLVRELWRRSPWLAGLAFAHFVLFAALLALSVGDTVMVMGVNRWTKPMKFALSIAFYLGALAWFAPALGTGRARLVPFAVAGATMAAEMVAILYQASRGVRSHFNASTPFDRAIFDFMGLLIALNTVALVWLGVLAARAWNRTRDGYRLGIALGIAVALLGSGIGGMMIAARGHAVGVADGGAGLPFVNWSTAGGDLRVAHFIGLHALQLLPLVGWRFGNRGVAVAAIAWLALSGLTLAGALAGRPLLPV